MRKSLLFTAVGKALPLFVLMGLGVAAPLWAQDGGDTDATAEQTEAKSLDKVMVLGSRRQGTSATETLVPVDIIPMTKAATQGAQFDLGQTLQFIAPSFNSTRQTGADGADLIDSAALRGLSADQTLVLVNGKRRHNVSLVNLFGARNRGATGTDLNTIPVLAIEQVEVLRDGAAAQYGSDAIAGVMNITLKQRLGCEGVLAYGQYSRGDGENDLTTAYCGVELGERGVLGVTAEYLSRNRSDRSGKDNPRTIGDSSVDNTTVAGNGTFGITDNVEAYFTGTYQDRDASSAAFARGGIGSDDIPSRNSAAMFPDGFVPFINGDLEDRYATVGARGDFGEWNVDLSTTYGYNELLYNISNTLNASIANANLLAGGAGISPTRFDAGGFSFRQQTSNLDISRYYDGVFQGLNVAFGGEYRDERYKIFAGEAGSFIDADGAGGGNAGSQGFPGFQPGDETNSSRDSWAAYVDLEASVTDRLMVDIAGRYEDYSDFGTTLNGKLAWAYRTTDSLRLRGSVSTGFRAPSLQQRFFSSTFTDFIGGVPTDVVLAPNGGAVANAAGIPKLKEETSDNFTLGFTWEPLDNLTLTVDGYWINIDDRIVLSGRFDDSDPSIGAILDQLGVGEAQFFVNSVDTKTRGVDVTAAHDMPMAGGKLVTLLGFNYNKTDVRRVNTPAALAGREDALLDNREKLFIENGAPRSKGTLAFDYTHGSWNGLFKLIYFGSQTLGTFSGPPEPNLKYDARLSADASLTYAFNQGRTKFTIGAANIFDKFPSAQNADETDNGFKYDSVQFGLNGTALFARLSSEF
jgi:iron complex outermembrane receptor protein